MPNPSKNDDMTSPPNTANQGDPAWSSTPASASSMPSPNSVPHNANRAGVQAAGGKHEDSRSQGHGADAKNQGERSYTQRGISASDEASACERSSTSDRNDSSYAIECLANCVEQILREIPRGASAQLKGAQDEFAKFAPRFRSRAAPTSTRSHARKARPSRRPRPSRRVVRRASRRSATILRTAHRGSDRIRVGLPGGSVLRAATRPVREHPASFSHRGSKP